MKSDHIREVPFSISCRFLIAVVSVVMAFTIAAIFINAEEAKAEEMETCEAIYVTCEDNGIAQIAQYSPNNFLITQSADVNVDINVTYGQSSAREMLSLINDFRAGSEWDWNDDNTTKTYTNNLSVLTYDYDLEKVAMQRAAETALYWSHSWPDGTKAFTSYSDYGYSYKSAAENIAAGPSYLISTASQAFESWREENDDYAGQGHRRNMLAEGYTTIGIGHVIVQCGTLTYHFWVQEFASPTSSGSYTSPNDSSSTVSVSLDTSMFTGCFTLSLTVSGTGTAQMIANLRNPELTYSNYAVPITSDDLSWRSSDTSIADVKPHMNKFTCFQV